MAGADAPILRYLGSLSKHGVPVSLAGFSYWATCQGRWAGGPGGVSPWGMLSPLLQLPTTPQGPQLSFPAKPSLFNPNWRPGNSTSFLGKGPVHLALETICRKNLELGTLKTYTHEAWVVSNVGSFTVQAKIHRLIHSFTFSLSHCLLGHLLSVRFGTKLV